jgi:phenylacetate 2-hydroxylase
MPIIDLESTASIAEILRDSDYGNKDIDPCAYFQRYALNTSLTLNYGYRIDGDVDDELLKEITHVERQVSTFRSTSNNWEDYVPLLRVLPKKRFSPFEYRDRRAKYMNKLLGMLKEKIADGTDKPCITGNILKDPEAKLNQAEIDSIGLTMVSAGLDTVPGNLIMGVGFLGTPSGRAIQQKAYEAIMSAYPNHDAWDACLMEEKVPYLTAFTKEVLRYFTVIPICLPRVSIKDIIWNGVTIPPGTTFYMNAYAADYDEERFEDAHAFRPERYLNETEDGPVENEGTPHFAYGAGSRMCAGSHLANRELYVAFLRLICAFEMVEGKDETLRPVMDTLEANAVPTSLTLDPKAFKIGLKVRNRGRLESWISQEALARHK